MSVNDAIGRDPSLYKEASEDFNYSALDSLSDTVKELLAEGGVPAVVKFIETREHEEISTIGLRQLFVLFFDPRSVNPKHWGLARALNIDSVRFLTDEQIGDHCGVTKAAISKEARQWIRLLGIPPNATMKSEGACEKYRSLRLSASTREKMSAR